MTTHKTRLANRNARRNLKRNLSFGEQWLEAFDPEFQRLPKLPKLESLDRLARREHSRQDY